MLDAVKTIVDLVTVLMNNKKTECCDEREKNCKC